MSDWDRVAESVRAGEEERAAGRLVSLDEALAASSPVWPVEAIEAAYEWLQNSHDPTDDDHYQATLLMARLAPFVEQRVRAAKAEALREFQRRWAEEPAEVTSVTGRSVRRIIAGAFESAAAEVEGGAREGHQ